MSLTPNLQTALLDLLHELRDSEIKLIIGGGYGIYLRRQHILSKGERTLLQSFPEARSTNDLDLFLRAELMTDSQKLKRLAEAIARLGYQVVPGAENYQFVKPGPDGSQARSLKLDILTGPQKSFHGSGLRVDDRRVHPKPPVGIHAHPVNEVPTLEMRLQSVALVGSLTSGEQWEAEVFLPHSFSFLTMKLFAFRDQVDNREKGYGRHHALDLYSIIALATEAEWEECMRFSQELGGDPVLTGAAQIVHEYFSGMEKRGMLRLRENAYYRPEFQAVDFVTALGELFSPKTSTGR